MSLRMRVVEAGTRAMYEADDAFLDSWESQPEEGVKDWYRRMFAIGFGGSLDCLSENADEWFGPSPDIDELLAVLRNPE